MGALPQFDSVSSIVAFSGGINDPFVASGPALRRNFAGFAALPDGLSASDRERRAPRPRLPITLPEWLAWREVDRYLPLTSELILKMGRMIAMAMKPTTEPMSTIMIGSIMLVTALMASRSTLA